MSSVAYRDDRTDDLARFSVFSTDLSESSAEPKFAPQPFVPQVALLRIGLLANPLSDLTARELQILSLLAQGKPTAITELAETISSEPMDAPPPFRWRTLGEDVVTELGRLKTGWAGNGSVAPPRSVLSDVERVLGYLPPHTHRPTIEVDDETGHVALFWFTPDKRSMFSLVFSGNRHVVGCHSSLEAAHDSRPWKYEVSEENKLVAALDADIIRNVLSV